MAEDTSTASTPTEQPEEWRPVPGYEGLCEVSDRGRVRALDRIRRGGIVLPGHMKRQYQNGGYWFTSISRRDGKLKIFPVHGLVAAAFIGPKPPGMQVNHISGVKADNRPSNLEYVTPSQNTLHAYRLGLKTSECCLGERNFKAKLNPEKVVQIRAMIAAGLSKGAVARNFGVSSTTIRQIIFGKNWRHVPDHTKPPSGTNHS